MALSKSNSPAVYTPQGVTATTGSLESLKGSHVSFNGYSIDVNETITFGTIDEYGLDGNIKKVPTYNGSSRYSILVRVNRTKNGVVKDSWFNMGVLSRQMNTAEGKSVPVDKLRENMIAIDDDYDRLIAIAGKTIKGIEIKKAFRPAFERSKDAQGHPVFTVVKNEDGSRKMDPADYVVIDYVK